MRIPLYHSNPIHNGFQPARTLRSIPARYRSSANGKARAPSKGGGKSPSPRGGTDLCRRWGNKKFGRGQGCDYGNKCKFRHNFEGKEERKAKNNEL